MRDCKRCDQGMGGVFILIARTCTAIVIIAVAVIIFIKAWIVVLLIFMQVCCQGWFLIGFNRRCIQMVILKWILTVAR